MKKIFIPLLILLFIIAAIGVTLYLVKQSQENRSKAAPATTLTFSPSSATAQVGDTFTLDILINTGDNTVSAAELHVNYDQTIFEGKEIAPGTFLTTELVHGAIGQGNASITLGSPPTSPQKGNGKLASLKLKAIKATTTASKVTFDGSTQVAGIGEAGDVLVSKRETSITVSGGTQITYTPTVTPSPTGVNSTGTPTITPSPTSYPSNSSPTPTATPSPTRAPGVGGPTSSPTLTPTPTTSAGSGPLNLSVQNGQTITNSLPVISGTAAPNSKVTVTIQSEPQTYTTTADANGKWSITPSKALETGSHTMVVTATDASGKTVTQSVSFTVGLPKTSSFFNTWGMLFLGSLLMFLGFLKLAI